MSAPVVLNLFNKLGKEIKMQGLLRTVSMRMFF